jgi:hypothetical protein
MDSILLASASAPEPTRLECRWQCGNDGQLLQMWIPVSGPRSNPGFHESRGAVAVVFGIVCQSN